MIDDDILDVSDALDEWVRSTLVKTVTVTTVNFVKTEQVTGRTQDVMVQVASPSEVLKRGLDVEVQHIRAHSGAALLEKELIEFNGKDYRVLPRSQWGGYGYTDVMAAETKQPLKVVSP